MLSAHGISAHVLGDDAGGAAPHFNLGSGGGYTIQVPSRDREAAEELLQARDASGTDGETSTNSPLIARSAIGRVFAALALAALLVALVWSTVT